MVGGKKTMTALAALALACVSAAALATVFSREEPVLVSAKELTIDTRAGLRVYQGQPFTGIAQRYDRAGKVVQMDSFVDGLRHGPSKIWFPNGQLSYESHFEEGKRQGETRSWWVNGNLRSQATFVADKQEGELLSWYATGEKYKRHNYHNGQPVGLQRAWRKNGKLYENFEVRGGRTYGLRNAKICVELKDDRT